MEIITFIKAGLKSKKGSFAGFFMLTLIIMSTVAAAIGIKQNYESALKCAFDNMDKGTAIEYLDIKDYSKNLVKEVENHPLVDHVRTVEAIFSTGERAGDKYTTASYVLEKVPETLRCCSDDMKELYDSSKTEKLKKGEIYMSNGCAREFDLGIGDKITVSFVGFEKEFTVKSYVEEPFFGSTSLGMKILFISDEDFDEIYNTLKQSRVTDGKDSFFGYGVFIYPKDTESTDYACFYREVNSETHIGDISWTGNPRNESEKYTGIFINIIISVTMGFAAFLFFIFLIISAHSIGTEIDIEYENLGIMKSQGFSDNKIQLIYIGQYMIVEISGIITGILLSIPLERILSSFFVPITSIIPGKGVPIGKGILIGLGIIIFTTIFIFLVTRKISHNSPAKAITRGREDVYFSNMIQFPLSKRFLNSSLGMRGITSAPKRYLSVIFITILLVFAVITITLEGAFITSDRAVESMGEYMYDIDFTIPDESDLTPEDIESVAEKYTGIKERGYNTYYIASINGEEIACMLDAYPRQDRCYIGRDIMYDDEITITENVCELLGVTVGDKVTVGFKDKSSEYTVVGIFQTMHNLGDMSSMTLDGFRRLCDQGDSINHYMSHFKFNVEDSSYKEKIVEEVKSLYGEEEVSIKAVDRESFLGETGKMFYLAADGSEIMIYSLTFLFALITVMMVCTKVFIQERTDIGVCHAIGFSVRKLRIQFASRFAIVCTLSTVIGMVLARLFSVKVIQFLFSMFGINRVVFDYNPMYFIIPGVICILCYMVFGYMASYKVRRVSTRELITE